MAGHPKSVVGGRGLNWGGEGSGESGGSSGSLGC